MRWHADGTGSAPEAARRGWRRRRALAAAVLFAALAHGLLGGALRAGGVWPSHDATARPALEVVGILTLTDPPPVASPAAPPPQPPRAAPGADRMQAVPVPVPSASAVGASDPRPDEPSGDPPSDPGREAGDPVAARLARDTPTTPADATAASADTSPSRPVSGADGPPLATADAGTDVRAAAAGASAPEATGPDPGRAAAAEAPPPAGARPGAPPFEWPPSTRVTYDLTGWYRGEVQGRAQVEWVREGDRYVVRLDVAVGLPIAPLMSRRMASEGRLTERGLAPERYDEVTQVALREPRRVTLAFTPLRVRLADGRELPVPPAVQDTASQFIQMAYRFATEPGLAEAGGVLELPLSLPRRVDTWTYDVLGAGPLATPFGTLTAVQVRPRPPADRRDVLTAEAWFAPGLRWLPVRIRIRQDAETHVDLRIARLPDLLAREGESAVDRSRTAPPPSLGGDPADPLAPR